MFFLEQYEKWQEKCVEELREKGFSEGDIRDAQICENGQVKLSGSLYAITDPDFVTSWFNSEHYVHWLL